MKSAVLWTPIANRSGANMIASLMGYGDGSYTIELSNDDMMSVTHIACRADVSDEFIQTFINAHNEEFPPHLPEQLHAVIASINADFSDELFGAAHLDHVLNSIGMGRM